MNFHAFHYPLSSFIAGLCLILEYLPPDFGCRCCCSKLDLKNGRMFNNVYHRRVIQLECSQRDWMAFFTVIAVVSFCLEISHHFVQVARTRRCGFAPPWSTAAAETEPTEFILETLEQSDQRSLMQYLAYQDLCVEPWHQGAFFEESGETYKRIVTACPVYSRGLLCRTLFSYFTVLHHGKAAL
ncbi:hypothetical protein SETIT_6G010200v2 [Setaria italica]|uniref:Uncharacterized protein n=1 Tax=Setaria italica TaxID=4555 RepID=K3YJT9_SETIT|nr:hypothetical protein SETIT_6G010200v2 [Setaria italica]